ncbi:endonuclease [Aliamphritea spongicola]|nr:endonuclease [Aliamphritea spongicola]
MKCILLTTALSLLSATAAATCIKPDIKPYDPDTYYSSITNQQGTELKSALNKIIRGHTRFSYKCTWTILKEADEDPNNSNNVIGFYTQRSIPKVNQDQGENDPDFWNREHIWSKSHGFRSKKQHAYTDAHHLRAADRSVNSDRSNNDFANGGKPDDECTLCKEGKGTWEVPTKQKVILPE